MSCIFCAIARHEMKSDLVYENEHVVAFKDLHPVAPLHVLVIPKQHVTSMAALTAADAELIGHLLLAGGEVARQLGIEAGGYRWVTNHGVDGGQTVPHLHFHLLGGRPMTWPPG